MEWLDELEAAARKEGDKQFLRDIRLARLAYRDLPVLRSSKKRQRGVPDPTPPTGAE